MSGHEEVEDGAAGEIQHKAPLSVPQLVLRRGLAVLVAVLLVVISIAVHLTYPPPQPFAQLKTNLTMDWSNHTSPTAFPYSPAATYLTARPIWMTKLQRHEPPKPAVCWGIALVLVQPCLSRVTKHQTSIEPLLTSTLLYKCRLSICPVTLPNPWKNFTLHFSSLLWAGDSNFIVLRKRKNSVFPKTAFVHLSSTSALSWSWSCWSRSVMDHQPITHLQFEAILH